MISGAVARSKGRIDRIAMNRNLVSLGQWKKFFAASALLRAVAGKTSRKYLAGGRVALRPCPG